MEEDANKNMTCDVFSESQAEFYEVFSWSIEGVVSIFISGLGILLNTIAIIILSNKRIGTSFFNRLLVCLAGMDNLFLFATIYNAVTRIIIKSHSFHHLYIFVNIVYPARSILMCSSTYTTVCLSFERYTFLTKPIYHRTRHNTNTYSRLVLYITAIVTLSFLYYIPRFFDLELETFIPNCENGTETIESSIRMEQTNCSIKYYEKATEIRKDHNYILWYINVSSLLVTGVIPGVLLGFFNYKIYNSLKRSNIQRASMISRGGPRGDQPNKNSSDYRRTIVLFAIVVIFVLCHSLRIILNIEEVANRARNTDKKDLQGCSPLRFWAVVLIPISSLLIQVNASANFFIYCFCDTAFKQVLTSILSIRETINLRTAPRTRETFKLQELA